jgi:hypothetical protein
MTLNTFIMLISALCTIHDCSVTSWIRTAKRNAAVGGTPHSRHISGFACDLVPDVPNERQELIRHAQLLGLQPVDEGDHIHIEYDNGTR